MTAIVSEFRFDAGSHTYFDSTGSVVTHTTELLTKAGWIDDTWWTDEHSERGRMVHSLTADYDLGALDLPTCVSRFRPYLLAHVACLQIVKPTIEEVEQPWVHPGLRVGTRPDRTVRLNGARGVWEIKSGVKPATRHGTNAHRIQTAIQALVLESKFKLPAEMWLRLCEYINHRGKFKLEDHGDTKAKDFAEARRIVKTYAR